MGRFRTARTIEDINRAVGLGYWPDVRFIEYDEIHLRSKISVGQNKETGKIDTTGDYRSRFPTPAVDPNLSRFPSAVKQDWVEAIPFSMFYQYYQQVPIAAYLIPRGIADGIPVLVEDPIEDLVGWRWNQGNAQRAMNVRGRIDGRRVVLKKECISVSDVVG